ncbi:flavodoxin family protein [Acetanaerobacterium sp. MSJ-12]|uniref:flavodoxin family protein n=1 Tax=Acetanaerobacterium sp. MSJ-12 TaxID=2841535 RepID=UPI001C0E94F3|nr:flavodoxin family protein [Acetanaerobacterium sp. MSJ-12]MBU5419749.1 flavodoxin family protein [Acetanaerobacterium sp. MSJ-12]
MKIIALNGSPRKGWNTHQMLEAFLEGARAADAETETELVHLFDLSYTGCRSCFACKRKGGPSYGRCAYPDGARELLAALAAADGIVCGSPIYFHDITAQLRGLLERLFFPFHSFRAGETTLAPKPLRSAMIYTMNVTEEEMRAAGYPQNLATTEGYFSYTFGHPPALLYACDTWEFSDYSLYEASIWDEAAKWRRRQEQFPHDLAAARAAGMEMVRAISIDHPA